MARPAPRPRKYEMMIVVAPTVTEDGLSTVVERVTALVEAQDGEVESFTHDSPWGRRRLAYPIQNFRDAFYVLYYLHLPPRAIGELDRELRLDEAIIRHLIVKYDPLAEREIHGDDDDEDGETEEAAASAASVPEDTDGDDDAGSSDDEADSTDDDDDESESDDDEDTVEESDSDSDDGEDEEE